MSRDPTLFFVRPNPVYSDAPYTVRGSACGEQGSHIHFTPGKMEVDIR